MKRARRYHPGRACGVPARSAARQVHRGTRHHPRARSITTTCSARRGPDHRLHEGGLREVGSGCDAVFDTVAGDVADRRRLGCCARAGASVHRLRAPRPPASPRATSFRYVPRSGATRASRSGSPRSVAEGACACRKIKTYPLSEARRRPRVSEGRHLRASCLQGG